jgi:hypothetical protein
MDLATVVTHEMGHALGFEHSDAGVMEADLMPGVRLIPEALSGTGSVVVSPTLPGEVGVSAGTLTAVVPVAPRADELGAAQPSAGPFSLARTGAVDAVLAVAVMHGVTPAAAMQEGPVSQPGIPVCVAAPAPALLSAVATPPVVVSATDLESIGDLVPGVRPSRLRTESWNGANSNNDDAGAPTGVLLPAASPTDALLWQRVSHACFADDSWTADLADTAPVLSGDSAAVTALALALGGWKGIRPTETEPRKRQRFLIGRI